MSTLNLVAIGQRLKGVREKARLPQEEFGQRLGIVLRTYASYERGERPLSVEGLKSLYEEFQVDPIWLLLGPEAGAQQGPTRQRLDLLVEIIITVEQRLATARQKLPLEKKAKLIALLNQYFQEQGEIEEGYIERAMSFTSL